MRMKTSDIKQGRFYRNDKSGNIRFVLEEDTDDFDVKYVVWCDPNPDKTRKEDQPLDSFTEWADEEVVPFYHVVARCPKCDEPEWIDRVDPIAECCKCGTVWDL